MPQIDLSHDESLIEQVVAENNEDLIDILNASGADFELGHFCFNQIKKDLNDAELGHCIRIQAQKIEESWNTDDRAANSIAPIVKPLTVVFCIVVLCLIAFVLIRKKKKV